MPTFHTNQHHPHPSQAIGTRYKVTNQVRTQSNHYDKHPPPNRTFTKVVKSWMLCVSCEWSKRKKFYGSLSGNQKWFPYSCLKTTKTSYLHSRNEHEWLWLLKSVLLFRNLLSLLMSINKEKEAKTNHNILYVHAILSNIFIVMQIKLLFSNWYPSINLKPYLSGSKINSLYHLHPHLPPHHWILQNSKSQNAKYTADEFLTKLRTSLIETQRAVRWSKKQTIPLVLQHSSNQLGKSWS